MLVAPPRQVQNLEEYSILDHSLPRSKLAPPLSTFQASAISIKRRPRSYSSSAIGLSVNMLISQQVHQVDQLYYLDMLYIKYTVCNRQQRYVLRQDKVLTSLSGCTSLEPILEYLGNLTWNVVDTMTFNTEGSHFVLWSFTPFSTDDSTVYTGSRSRNQCAHFLQYALD